MICSICERDLEIPADAIVLRQRFGIWLYQFKNGDVHQFKIVPRAPRRKVMEPKPTIIVLPPKLAEPIPVVVEPVPVPAPKTLDPEPKTQEESQSFGTMAAAFSSLRSKFQNPTKEKE